MAVYYAIMRDRYIQFTPEDGRLLVFEEEENALDVVSTLPNGYRVAEVYITLLRVKS